MGDRPAVDPRAENLPYGAGGAARGRVAEAYRGVRRKLDVLRQQQVDLSGAIDALLDDIAAGRKYMKVYKQMKMYNDPELNPVLYASK